MSRRIQYICHALLLSVLVVSCAQTPPGRSTSPALKPQAPTVFHLGTSALAYGIFETTASSVHVDVYNTTPKVSRAFGDISIEDGSGITTYKVGSGESTVVHSMPAGKKHVIITSGGQSNFNNEIRGVFVHKITFDGPAIQLQPASPQILIYGDSLAVGGNVDSPSAEAWPVLLRKRYSVQVDAYGYRMLYDDASTAEKRSEFAARVSAWKPNYIWLAIGTNDYEFGQWSAQEFGRAYAALLDAIHLSNPQAILFAQSPILKVSEVSNIFGDDLESYRRQIATACSLRKTWCTFVNGTSPEFPQLDELDKDGTHLTGKSSQKYAEAVLNILSQH